MSAGPIWHRGEVALQESLGLAERMREVGARAIRDHMVEQHQSFFRSLPFVVLGSVDGAGDAWASLRAGRPGFLAPRDPHHLDVAVPPDPDDPAEAGLVDGTALALLGIDPATRRRNRLNGRILQKRSDGFTLAVRESYGNCPRHIHARTIVAGLDAGPVPPGTVVARSLDARARAMIAAADTFFVASYAAFEDGELRADVSHRGGPVGFARIAADGTLTIPDYDGNRFFNTLGNIATNARAGLAFVDFATGDLLQMTGHAHLVADGAERAWRFVARAVWLRAGVLPLRFEVLQGPIG